MPFSAKTALMASSFALALLAAPLMASAQGYADDELLGGPLRTPAASIPVPEETIYEAHADATLGASFEEVTYVEETTPPVPQMRTVSETPRPQPGQRQLSWQGRNDY